MERQTRQRNAIRDAIADAGRPLLPQEVLAAAQAAVDEGALRTVMLPGESARYEVAGGGHHHHFQCRGCRRVFEVHACPGDMAALAPAGFTVEDHELTLYGRCGDCAPARAGPKRGSARG
jgi:Fur family ferric uptake transcriptional regulator